VCIQMCIAGVEFGLRWFWGVLGGGGGVPVESYGWFLNVSCALGVWLAMGCDAVGGGKKCVSFIMIILFAVHTWSFSSRGNCVGSSGVKTCCS
jgi:hypothetical protein